MDYYYADGDVQKGPVSLADLSRLSLKPDTLVWREGMGDWQRADAMPELASLLQSPAGAAPPQQNASFPSAAPTAAAPWGPYSPGVPPAYPQQAGAAPDYPQAPGQPLAYGGYAPAAGPRSGAPNTMAIASMILGICSIPATCLCFMTAPLAAAGVILGHVALSQIKRGQGTGRGMAIAGLSCGYVGIALVVLRFVVPFVMWGMSR